MLSNRSNINSATSLDNSLNSNVLSQSQVFTLIFNQDYTWDSFFVY